MAYYALLQQYTSCVDLVSEAELLSSFLRTRTQLRRKLGKFP